MIIDGRSPGLNGSTYDVVVVGSGPAGTTVALELSSAGLRVALIESGGLEFDPDTQALYSGEVTGLEETDLTAARLRMLGGTSNHWGGFCLPLDPVDFDRAPRTGKTGWPIGRDDLMGYYRRAHEYLDLGAFNYQILPDKFGDVLLPRADALIELATLRLSAGPPTNFGEKYRETLATSQNIDVWLWTNMVALNMTEAGAVESIRTLTLSGLERTFFARRFVLACGAVGNARQLLLFNRGRSSGIGGTGNSVGSCYMDHLSGGGAFLWPRSLLPKKVEWSEESADVDGTPLRFVWRLHDAVIDREQLANAHFYLVPFSSESESRIRAEEAARGMAGLKGVAKWALGRDEPGSSLSQGYCEFISNADSMVANLVLPHGDVDRVLIRYEAEQQPDDASHITLSSDVDHFGLPRPVLHWSPIQSDKESLIRSLELLGQSMGAADVGRVELEEGSELPYWNFTTAWHQMGTTRMANSPSDGAVDSNCLTYGTKNLFMAGGSVMPTGGRANPTLTITALAIRLADHLAMLERGDA